MSNDYLPDVQRYDVAADGDTVQRIVRHLGIALQGRDAALVSCADGEELARLRDKWCVKKLGETDEQRCDAAIAKVCDAMRGDRAKQRVTFYYLVARELGRLDRL